MAKLDETMRRTVSVFVDEMTEQRRHRGWTQQDLAGHCTYSKALIAAVESYERAPTIGLALPAILE